MPAPIFNLDDAEFLPHPRPAPGPLGEKFQSTHCRISGRLGARQLGYNLTAVPPGKRAFPFHSHRVNEEMFFVLEGTGELRLGEAGRDALGFAVQVPHYLAQAVYPPAALALLGSVTTSTGLDLPDAELREAADRTNEAIERQVEESAEVAELVRALEQQYDTAAESQQAAVDAAAGLLADGEAMPTADELAAQFERFLAENQDRTDPPDH